MLHNWELLVSSEQLVHKLDSIGNDLAVIDCRHNPRDFSWGRLQYNDSHIPGAIHLSLHDDLSGQSTGINGRHPLPIENNINRYLSKLGVTRESTVVVYDDTGSNYAARCWWTLRWLGYENVSILDGGWGKWLKQHRPTSMSNVEYKAHSEHEYFSRSNGKWFTNSHYVLQQLDNPLCCLIDARHPDAFNGVHEWQDPVKGHIPGSVNHFYKNNLNDDDTFKSSEELKSIYLELLDGREAQQVINSCGSGVNACCNIFSMELAGLHGSRLYPGSWSEWCSDQTRAMVVYPDE